MATRRNLSLAPALVALVALVAIASRAHAPAGGGSTHGIDSKYIWEFVLIGFVGMFIICLPIALWVMLSTRVDAAPARKKRKERLRRIAIGMVILLVGLTIAAGRFHLHNHQKAKQVNSTSNPAAARKIHNNPGKPVPFDWLPAIVVLSVAGVVAVAIGIVLFRRPSGKLPRRAEVAARLSAVLDESLDDLRSERDPRRAVIAAYARMEQTLARAGLPRSVGEAPLEYLGGVLRELLRTSAEAVSRLTALLERAKFSPHRRRSSAPRSCSRPSWPTTRSSPRSAGRRRPRCSRARSRSQA